MELSWSGTPQLAHSHVAEINLGHSSENMEKWRPHLEKAHITVVRLWVLDGGQVLRLRKRFCPFQGARVLS